MLKSAFAAVAACAFATAVHAAPVQTLFVTDGDAARLAMVNGTTVTTASTFYTAYPLAVRDTIWMGTYYGNTAREYTLAGVATGNTLASTAVYAVDGASYGSKNYSLGSAFGRSATVYSANADWSGQTAMFSVSGSQLVGITVSSKSGNLWVSDMSKMYEYTMSGVLVSSFEQSGGRGSLAYESKTDTLWYVPNSSNTLLQYSTKGVLLDTVEIAGLRSNNWGAEFSSSVVSVPEPGNIALLGLGVLALVGARRQRAG